MIPLGTGFPRKELSLVAVGKQKKGKSPEKTIWQLFIMRSVLFAAWGSILEILQ